MRKTFMAIAATGFTVVSVFLATPASAGSPWTCTDNGDGTITRTNSKTGASSTYEGTC